MKISPALMIAIVGAAAVFFYMQRNAKAAPAPKQLPLQPGGVPQGWIEQTPAGYTVVGTSDDLYDIAT